MADYYTVMTEIGRIKLAQASANNGTLNLATMALGDGAGSPVALPDGYEEALVNEVYRAAINSVIDDGAQFTVDMVVPPEEGGWVVREMGVFDDDGDLIAYANTPPIDKPAAQTGIVIDFRPTLTVEFDAHGSVTIQINPAIISASQQWVDDNYLAKGRNLADLSDKAAACINLGRGQANGLASLDSTGKVPEEQMPIQRLSEVFTAADENEMLALEAEKGDVCVRTDENKTYILSQAPAATLANWVLMQSNTIVISVAGKTGTVDLEKTDVGLANVDNTSDADKPVSIAQGQAIATAQGNAKDYTDDEIGALNKSSVGLANVDNTSDANKPVSTAQAQAISAAQTAVQTNLNTHADNTSNAHGATPAATKNALMRRDALGRAQVEAPNAAKDIANKAYVDSKALGNIQFWGPVDGTDVVNIGNDINNASTFARRGIAFGLLEFVSVTKAGTDGSWAEIWASENMMSKSNPGDCIARFYVGDWSTTGTGQTTQITALLRQGMHWRINSNSNTGFTITSVVIQ